MTATVTGNKVGFEPIRTFEELGALTWVISLEVECVSLPERGAVEVGETYTAVYYKPSKNLICLDFDNGFIGWYDLKHFDYKGKPEVKKSELSINGVFTLPSGMDTLVFCDKLNAFLKENGITFTSANAETERWKYETSHPDYPDRLRAALTEKSMTQSEFARKCGCSASRISALLRPNNEERVPKYIWENAKKYLNM